MNSVLVIGIIFGVAVVAVAIFGSIPADTWKDKRTDSAGVAPPDESDEMIDCFSKGGDWDGTSCNVELFEKSFEESFEESFDVSSQRCSGNARCITGALTSVIDGDTIKVEGQTIRFALASAPELHEFGGADARKFIETLCPVGSTATVDEDDGQTEGSHGRMIAVIYCNGVNLNEELLDSTMGVPSGHCDVSEFAEDSWAQKHGC